jgi:hypothetical protein
MPWGAGHDRPSVQEDPAGVSVIDAVDGVGDLGDTGADKSVETDDLAGSNDDIDIVVFTSPPEVDKFESWLGLWVDLPFVLRFGQDAANHQLDDLAHRQLLDRVRADGLPVAHDEHIVGDAEQLVEAVGNVDHRDP